MTVVEVLEASPDQGSCIRYLEKVRWGDSPQHPHCESYLVGSKRENDRVGRWHCHSRI